MRLGDVPPDARCASETSANVDGSLREAERLLGPAPMPLKLPTMAEVNAVRRATPKHQIPTKVERVKEKRSADAEDRRKLAQWSKAVRERDQHVDRFDGNPVLKTLDAHPRRGEAHHVEPRSNRDVHSDVRNGNTLARGK